AGNSLEDAILHGLCECVERDLCKCAWFAIVEAGLSAEAIGARLIQPDSLTGATGDLIARLRDDGLSPYLIDCSLDLNVPTVWSVVLENAPGPRRSRHPMDGL